TDGTYAAMCDWALADPRVVPLWGTENTGPAAARNRALRQARGTYVTYLDCDDEYFPDYLKAVAQWGPRADVLVFAYEGVNDGRPGHPIGARGTWEPVKVREHLLVRNISGVI